ncbi:MAG: hypothetical protein PHW73_14970 [Atribacterota bacterium]|nr:hypothetical protein [Atribacterota bacterium]
MSAQSLLKKLYNGAGIQSDRCVIGISNNGSDNCGDCDCNCGCGGGGNCDP